VHPAAPTRAPLTARVATGDGRAASFTNLAPVREQFVTRLGIDPHPGTLNLQFEDPGLEAHWPLAGGDDHVAIDNPQGGGCAAWCLPVRIGGRVPGAVVRPQVAGYPGDKLEVAAAVGLRALLALSDGDEITLEATPVLATGALIFDVDGTLVDSITALWKLAAAAAAPFGIEVPLETVRRVLNVNHHRFWELVVPTDYPDRERLFPRLDAEARRQWHAILRAEARVYPELSGTLERLRAAGIPLGIVTASRGESLALLEAAGLLELFDAVVTANDVAQRKPHPEGLFKCAAALGVAASRAVYVGDSIADVQAARAAGMPVIGVLSGAGSSADLSAEGADRLAFDHASLPGMVVRGSG
jgi:2-phosphoglycolate phosphatase